MSAIFELDQKGWEQSVADSRLMMPDPEEVDEAGFFEGAIKGKEMGAMKGFARLGQAAGVLASPVVKAVGEHFDPSLMLKPEWMDPYYEALDETANDAVDFWTPDARTVGSLGRVWGGLNEGLVPLAATAGNPSAMIATAQIGTSMDLVRQGVDADTAVAAGLVQSTAAAAGIKLPIGKTMGQRVFSGAFGNVGVNMSATFAQQKLLEGAGYDEIAKQYDPLDVEGRTVDLLLGTAFGVLPGDGPRLSPSQRASVLAAANARHFQVDTAPGRPLDAEASRAHQEAMAMATEALLFGDEVAVPPAVAAANFEPRPARVLEVPEELASFEAARAAAEALLDAPAFGLKPPPRPIEDADPVLQPRDIDTTPERVALRDAIVNDEIKNAPTVTGRKPVAILMGGGGASGKGTVLKQLIKRGMVPERGAVHIDPDALKARLPEYGEIVKRGDSRAAAVVHEESSALAKRVIAEAIKKNADIVLDRTLADEAKALKEIKALKDAGYEVRLFGVTVDPLNAIRRADKRAQRTMRFVPPKELLKAHKGFASSFERLAGEVDSARLFDNEVPEGSQPKLLAQKDSGKSLSITDPEGYNVFRERSSINAEAHTAREIRAVGAAVDGRDVEGGNRGDSQGVARGDGSARSEPGRAPASGDLSSQRLTSPAIDAVRELLAERDVRISTGEVDADGNAVTRSGREIMAANDAAFEKAKLDAKGIEAAVNCLITRGPDAA